MATLICEAMEITPDIANEATLRLFAEVQAFFELAKAEAESRMREKTK
jgi:hypothetical protein